MPQVPAEKSYFTFQGGLNTDASLIAFPEETTSDEANFELLNDGSRRRRRGLDQEVNGNTLAITPTLGVDDAVTSIIWRDAGSLGDNFVVIQHGSKLIFSTDSETATLSTYTQEIDLLEFKVTGKQDSDVSEYPVSMDIGQNNKLLVAGRYINPFYLEWDGTDFTANRIYIKERDFVGIVDSINIIDQPVASSATHTYNLRARGWKQANITSYASAKSKQPAKNMWPWQGYRRTNVAGIAETDGTWGFSADKMESGLFGAASAALGHLLHTPFDTTITGLISGVDYIESISFGVSSATITATAHGLSNGNSIYIENNSITYLVEETTYNGTINGTWVISGVTTDTFDIPYTIPDTFVDVVTYGSFYLSTAAEVVTNPSPYTTSERPQIVKWYAGRAWYMGIQDTKLKDKIYFSQIVEDENQYGNCYQQADPTDPDHNELVATDGGYVIIPGIGEIKGARIFNDSLIVLGTTGVWQIKGSRGIFSADDYTVNKITDFACTSTYGITSIGDSLLWTGFEGVSILLQDPQTGYLVAKSLTDDRLQTLWRSIPATLQTRIKVAYDKTLEKVYILYQSLDTFSANRYDTCLVYAKRKDAFYKLVFPSALANYIVDLFAITPVGDEENNKNIKFIVQTSTRTQLKICDLDQADYVDFDGAEQVPYMVTGYDNLSDFHRYKQAPVLHFFCKKTETGYTLSGTDLVPIDESSVLVKPIWDWSDNANSGKYGPQQQVYRHKKYYQPVDANDTYADGYPVVVTRNKLRGRGRVLHLRIDGEATKAAHILGWSLQYKANRKV